LSWRTSTPSTEQPRAARREPARREARWSRCSDARRRQVHHCSRRSSGGRGDRGARSASRVARCATCRRTAWPGSGSASCPRTAGSSRTFSVLDNLMVARGRTAAGRSIVSSACFRGSPVSRRQRGGSLSGGEQQMLTIAAHADDRASPAAARRALGGLRRWSWPRSLTSWAALRRPGLSILMAEQNCRRYRAVGDRGPIHRADLLDHNDA